LLLYNPTLYTRLDSSTPLSSYTAYCVLLHYSFSLSLLYFSSTKSINDYNKHSTANHTPSHITLTRFKYDAPQPDNFVNTTTSSLPLHFNLNHRKTHSKCSSTVLLSSPLCSPFSVSQTLPTPPLDTTDDTTVSPPVKNQPPEALRRSLLEPTLVTRRQRGPSSVPSRRGVLSSNAGSEDPLHPLLPPLPPALSLVSPPTVPSHLLPLLSRPLQSPIRTLGPTR
jgi:hypothetical protein